MNYSHDDHDNGGILTGMPIELKFLNGMPDSGIIEGYASTFSGTDASGDVMLPGAFSQSLAEHKRAGTSPAMLWNHADAIGKWLSIGEDNHGLHVKGALNLDSTSGQQAYSHLKNSGVNGLSVGIQVPAGGQSRGTNGSGRILTRVILHEVSVTPTPMDTRARVMSVKSTFNSRDELEEILVKHLPRGAVRKLIAGGWNGIIGEIEPDPATAAAALARTLAITRLASKIDAAVLELQSLRNEKC